MIRPLMEVRPTPDAKAFRLNFARKRSGYDVPFATAT
jgi:hypothetical protein